MSRDPELLTAYLDGELDPTEAAEVDAWLAEDPGARAELDDLSRVRSLVRGLPAVDPPFGFYERMVIDDRKGTRPLETRRPRRLGLAGAAAAMVAAAVLLVGFAPTAGAVVPPVDVMANRHAAMEVSPDPAAATAAGATGGFEVATPTDMASMAEPMVVPDDMGPMHRLMVFHAGDDMMHVVYGDGDHMVSLYEQEGTVDWAALPSGTMVSTPVGTAWMAPRGAGETVMVVERAPVVFTLVASMPGETVMGMVDELPEPSESVVQRLQDSCSQLNAAFALGS